MQERVLKYKNTAIFLQTLIFSLRLSREDLAGRVVSTSERLLCPPLRLLADGVGVWTKPIRCCSLSSEVKPYFLYIWKWNWIIRVIARHLFFLSGLRESWGKGRGFYRGGRPGEEATQAEKILMPVMANEPIILNVYDMASRDLLLFFFMLTF